MNTDSHKTHLPARFLRAIELIPGAAAVTNEWRHWLGDEFDCSKCLLTPLAELATVYSQFESGTWCRSYDVVTHGPDDLIGINHEEQLSLPLNQQDLVVFEINWPKILGGLKRVFALDGIAERCSSHAFTFRIGAALAPTDQAIAVFLTVQSEPDDFHGAVESIAASYKGPFIVVAPTNRFRRLITDTLLTTSRSSFVALAEAIALDPTGNFVLTDRGEKIWVAVLSTFCREVQPAIEGRRITKHPSDRHPIELRSWTQSDLNAAIRKFKADRVSTYADLAKGVQERRPGAKVSAQKIFGRNAIARALGVKSWAMVTKSEPWQEIAEELRLGKPRQTRPSLNRAERVDLEIASEQQAVQVADSVQLTGADLAVRRETISLLNGALSAEAAEDAIRSLTDGEIDDDQAREIVKEYSDQARDARSKRTYQRP